MNKGRRSSIGERRNLLTLQRFINTQAADGADVKTPVDVRQINGDVRARTGAERYVGQGTSAQVEYSVIVDYTDGIDPAMQVIWGSRTFDITAILPVDGRRKQLELLCTERV